MTATALPRSWLSATLISALAVAIGLMAARHSSYALALAGVSVVALLAFTMPVTHLTLLLALTAIVPYTIENRYHAGGAGAGSPGLIASDLFLVTGMLRTAMVLPRLTLTRRQMTVIGLVILSVLWTSFEAWQGFRAGQTLSNVGAEYRTLAGGIITALLAITVLHEEPAQRRMLRGLLLLGLALGLWGIAQWTLKLSFGTNFGVRPGVSLTSGGSGQLQGGLFGFPIAVVISVGALTSGRLHGWRQLGPVVAVLVVNLISLLLTFERTFWIAAIVGVLIVIVRAAPRQRYRALVWLLVTVTLGLAVLAAFSPGTLRTAEQRLLSVGQYQVDNSVRYRVVESGFVINKIKAKPLFGWGLADTIFWGQPWEQVPPTAASYTHVGYLWLFWREGLIGGSIILVLLLLTMLWPGRPRGGDLLAGVRRGCQASIAVYLIVDFTFPAFQGSDSTYVMGLLIAMCALPVLSRRTSGPPDQRPVLDSVAVNTPRPSA
ncbi:MAG: O-antigen ligase family protein [Solirubrobacteraceae bacterium]